MKIIKTIALVLIIVAVAVVIWGIPRIVRVNSINCSNQYGSCSDDLTDRLSAFIGGPYSEVKKSVVSLIESERIISDYLLQYKIGGKIDLDVIEKVARGAIKVEGQEQYYLIDSKGEVILKKDSTTLPTLEVGIFELKLNEVVNPEYRKALEILLDLNRLYGVTKGVVKDNALYINGLPGPLEGIFPLDKETDVLLGGLRLILDRLNAGAQDIKINLGREIKTIDLRFDNPVLR